MSEVVKTPVAIDESVPSSPSHHHIAVDPALERRILRKLDFQVVPILCFLFFISFVDRGNIANAKIQGMSKELHMKGNDYNIAVMLFTVAYIIFGLPTTILFKKVGPKSLSVMMFLWGICVICEGLVKTPAQIKAIRFIMGIFESGFVPGCAYLIGSYYKKDEFLTRYAWFFSMAVLAGAFNGLLATLFSLMSGVGGYSGWRWIFIMEGIITVVVSIASFWIIVSFPEQTTRFTPEEKAAILARVAEDEVEEDTTVPVWKRTLAACKDRTVILAILIYFGAEENASGTVAFQPTVLKGLGYSSTSAQVHSIPIYMTAWVLVLFFTWLSARIHQRYFISLLGCIITMIGLAIEIAQPRQQGVKYLGLFFLTTGNYIVMPITVVWLAINVPKGYKRAAALGLLAPIGNCGAILSSNVFITKESPVYHTGFSVGLGMNMLSLVAMTVLYFDLRSRNKRIERGEADKEEGIETSGSVRYSL